MKQYSHSPELQRAIADQRRRKRQDFLRHIQPYLPHAFVAILIFVTVFLLSRPETWRGMRLSTQNLIVSVDYDPLFEDFVTSTIRGGQISTQWVLDQWVVSENYTINEFGDSTLGVTAQPIQVAQAFDQNTWYDTIAVKQWLRATNQYTASNLLQMRYVAQFVQVAVDEMRRTGIPASITLSQGIVESASGTSRLAQNSNNHFGIKCAKISGNNCNTWIWQPRRDAIDCTDPGKFHDDVWCDRFCVYADASSSYVAHSTVLLHPRYRNVWKYPVSNRMYTIDKKWFGTPSVPYYAAAAVALQNCPDGKKYASDPHNRYHWSIADRISKLQLWTIDFAVHENLVP